MNSFKKIVLLTVTTMLLSCTASSIKRITIIRIKGSDTMLPLMRSWAEVYMVDKPGVSLYVEGGGTATGMEALAEGKVDICMASRAILPQEAQRLAQQFGAVGVSVLVAKDALSIYVNQNNPVTNLSLEQLKNIYTGQIKNWKQVGGDDAPIELLTRMPTSGTFLYFKEYVLDGQDYSPDAKMMPTTNTIIDAVAMKKYAIGYGGVAYEKDVLHMSINNVAPTKENVANDSYPLIRYLYLYTVDKPRDGIKDFIDWVLGEHGQDIVKWVGYFPIWKVD